VDDRAPDYHAIGWARIEAMGRPPILTPSGGEVISPEQLRARLEVVFEGEGGFRIKE